MGILSRTLFVRVALLLTRAFHKCFPLKSAASCIIRKLRGERLGELFALRVVFFFPLSGFSTGMTVKVGKKRTQS